MMPNFCSTPALALALLLAVSSPVVLADAADISEFERATQAINDLTAELEYSNREIDLMRERIRDAELNLKSDQITSAMLEQARLEIAGNKSRLSGLNTRLRTREESIKLIDANINDLKERLAESRGDADPETVQELEAGLRGQREYRDSVLSIIDTLGALKERTEVRVRLNRQYMVLLQSRFKLPRLNTLARPTSWKGRSIEREISALLLDSSRYRREAAAISGDAPRDIALKRLLELQTFAQEERAELLQNELKMRRVAQILRTLETFSNTPSTPEKVLRSGGENLERLASELQLESSTLLEKQTLYADQRQIISQQGAIVEGADSTLERRLKLVDDLASLAAERLKDVQALEAKVQTSMADYQHAINRRYRSELLERRYLPSDLYAWKNIASATLALPGQVAGAFISSIEAFTNRLKTAGPGLLGIGIVTILVIVLGSVWGRKHLARLSTTTGSDGEIEINIALKILAENFFVVLPPLIILLLALLYEVDQSAMIMVITPFLIWPVMRISIAYANAFIQKSDIGWDKKRILGAEFRVVISLAAVLAAIFVIAHSVALSPALVDIIDRLSMICLLLITIPLFHLRHFVVSSYRTGSRQSWWNWGTLAFALTLAVSALIGLSGYVNLATDITQKIFLLLVVTTGFSIARHGLHILQASTLAMMRERDPETAEFWKLNVFRPLSQLLLLGLLVLAGATLFKLYRWDAQTPIIGAFPRMLNYPLFTLGETPILVSNLIMAVVIITVVFWAGNWSKRVSYRWVYTGIEDLGIRNSLSTFTQYLVIVGGFLVALRVIGLDLTALTVFAGALGIGIGFGLQQIVVNFISGILLLVERPLRATDIVNVDKYEGEITRIGIRSLTVKTFDNQEVIIPNSSVITKPFINWTRSDDIMRTVLMIGISYDDDPHHALEIVRETVLAHPAVLSDPSAKFLLWEYADSALMLRAQFYTRIRGTIGRADVRSQILFSIWDRFKEEGITIPYPQRDLHIHNVNESAPMDLEPHRVIPGT